MARSSDPVVMTGRWYRVILFVVLPALWMPPAPADEGTRGELPQPDLEARITALIGQLGDPRFATRERAQAELQRLRLDAFDALNEAQYNDDIEISLSARYLVRGIQVNWSSEDDSLEVKQLLRGYSPRPDSERQNLIEQLSLLGADQALRPLCRLVRYEASEQLSKRAALAILKLPVPSDETARREMAELLRGRMGQSKRTAADWVRAYADLLGDLPAARDVWRELMDQEQGRLTQLPDQTSREVAREMLKWYADRLTQQALGEEAESIMRRMIGLLNPTQPEVLETIDWFRKRECWVLAAEVAERFPDLFRRSPQLLYRLAETHAQLGRHDKADQVAREAMAIISEGAEKHMEVAANLQHDGLFTWAEREYRHVAGLLEEAPSEAARAKLYLSEMLHDTRQDAAAGEVLEEMIRAVESDEDFRRIVEIELGRELGAIKSRKYFFQAQHQGRSGDRSGERASLLEGYRHDPHDADLLIAMYRLADADEAWMEETRERIGAAAEHFRSQIKDLTNRMNSSRAFEDRALASFQLALVHNQFAWLIANTEGDFDESLRCSRRSLELQPNRAGFLDTLGRCYYAKGDYVNAVKYQTQAVALEPHSPQMLAQLSLFETALEAQRAAPTPDPSAGEISD